MDVLGKWLIAGGLLLALTGVLVLFAGRIPLVGRLPGDFSFQRGGVSVYAPLATSLLLSILLTVVLTVVVRIVNR